MANGYTFCAGSVPGTPSNGLVPETSRSHLVWSRIRSSCGVPPRTLIATISCDRSRFTWTACCGVKPLARLRSKSVHAAGWETPVGTTRTSAIGAEVSVSPRQPPNSKPTHVTNAAPPPNFIFRSTLYRCACCGSMVFSRGIAIERAAQLAFASSSSRSFARARCIHTRIVPTGTSKIFASSFVSTPSQ